MKLKLTFIKVIIFIFILVFILIPIVLFFLFFNVLHKNYRTDYVKKYKSFLNYSLGDNWRVVSKEKGLSSGFGTESFYEWDIEYKDRDNLIRNFRMDNLTHVEDIYHLGFLVNTNLNNLINEKFTDEILSKHLPFNFNQEDQKKIQVISLVQDGDTSLSSEDYTDIFYKKISDPKTGIRLYDFNYKNAFINNSKFLTISIYIDKSNSYTEIERLKTSINKTIDDLNLYTNNTVNCLIQLYYDNKESYSVAIVNGRDVMENIDQYSNTSLWGNYVIYIKNYYNIEN